MNRISGGFWVVVLMVCAPAPGQIPADFGRVDGEQKMTAARLAGQRGPRTRLNAPETRQMFIDVERIARLPSDQQTQQLPGIYDSVVSRYPEKMDEVAGNTVLPEKLLVDRRSQAGLLPRDPGPMVWGKELDEAAAKMTPELVADTIVNYFSVRILYTATRRRLAYVLLSHKPELMKLVDEDLKSNTPTSTFRAFGVIHDLQLREFIPRSIEIYLAGGPTADSALYGISWVESDSAAAKKLVDQFEKDPSSLKTNAFLINSMLRNQPPEPRLLALLNSPDVDKRTAAAIALRDTHDPTMLGIAPKLLEDAQEPIRLIGIDVVVNSPAGQFPTARPLLIKLLDSPDKVVQLTALRKLADQKDPVTGPVLLRFLNDHQLTLRERSDAGVVVRVLLGWETQVDMQQWDQNFFVKSQVQEWIKSHPDVVK